MKKIILLSIIAISITNCKKVGCTDKDASNYNVDANKDNLSCIYESSVVFWYDKETSNKLINQNSNALSFYIDNDLIASSATTDYWLFSPSCGDDHSLSHTFYLDKLKSQVSIYKVVDEHSNIIASGSMTLSAHKCKSIQIIL